MTIPGGIAFAGGTLVRVASVRVAIPPSSVVTFGTRTRLPRAVPKCLVYVETAVGVATERNVFGPAALNPSIPTKSNVVNAFFVRDPGMTAGEYALSVAADWEDAGNIAVTADVFHYEVIP